MNTRTPLPADASSEAAAPRLATLRWRLALSIPLLSALLVVVIDGIHLWQDPALLQGLRAGGLLMFVARELALVVALSLTLLLLLERMLLAPLRRLAASSEAIDLTVPPRLDAATQIGEGAEIDQLSQSIQRTHRTLWEQCQEVQGRATSLRDEVERQREALRVTEQALEARTRELARMSRVDELTGLPNRREFDEALRREFKRAQRQGGALALAVLDLDNFKQYNTALGSTAGDAALQEFARLLAVRFKRDTDMVARLGGEEFVALLPDFGLAQAQGLLEQVREDLRAMQMLHGEPAQALTVSVGLATCHPARPYLSPQALLQAADEALYMAKHAGRDRLSLAA